MSLNVNKPMNKKLKEEDVNRKLQIYGIFTAFKNGKVPSNDQIDVALNSFLGSKALSNPPEKLSSEGKVLVQDVREVIEQAKKMLLSKNEGNLLQDFIWQTTQFDPKSVSSPNAPVTKDAAKRDGDEALQGLRTLGTLLITNGQFRKLLSDATILFRDMAGDAATNAATRVRPSDEQLAQMDQAAEDNTWHEKPDLSKDSLRKQAKGIYGGKPKKDAKDVAADTVGAGTQAVEAEGSTADAANRIGVQDTAQTAALNKIDKNMDPETKEKIKKRNEEYRRKAREYLKKKMPQERKDQTVWRLKKMVLECQQHSDYRQAMETIIRLAETYGKHGRTMGHGSAGSAKEARTGFAAAEVDLRTLIERFANGTSTADLWDSINQIYKDSEKDEELRSWFKKLDSYIRRCLLEQGYILEDDSNQEWDRLYEQGRYLLREKYRSHTNRVLDEIKFITEQFEHDPQNKAFGNACQKLFTDLGNDENGKPVFKPHLVKDLIEVIIPGILENTAYIPIPRIEYADAQAEAVIENLVLESDNFMPNVAEVASEHYFRWGRKKIASKNKNTIEVKMAGIQMDLRDVSYHVKRKQGFPALSDTGMVDILLPGDGFSMKMKLSSADKSDRQKFFKVDKVDIDIKRLKLKVTKSNHKLLFSLFKPIALRALRPPLQKAVEKAIKDQCDQMDTMLFEIKQEADRARDEATSTDEKVPNFYKRFYTAAQKRALQGKERAEEIAKEKKVNLAMTQEESILPNVKLPGGISSKATEYKELARRGEKWESPVFSIGAAQKSSDIPAAPTIERKSTVLTGTNGTNGAHGTNGTNGVNGAKAAVTGKNRVDGVPLNGNKVNVS